MDSSNLAGFDDAILLSSNGEISCGTTANLIIKRDNQWLTPRLESGCLPGIMREQGIKKGLFKEEEILSELNPNDEWLLINSLSCHSIKSINKLQMKEYLNSEKLWKSLLTNDN